MIGELTYICSPYSHPDADVRRLRYQLALGAIADMTKAGIVVYSPIVHNHNIATLFDLPMDWAFWKKFDEVMLSRCQKVIVLMIDGWKESVGIGEELEIAGRLKIPVEYMKL